MKVAVVTPYHRETDEQLNRCMDSVIRQTYADVTHIMVADGLPKPWRSIGTGFEHIVLSTSHSDAGATPRAIGGLSAFSRGFDAIAFLDADNWYEPDHIEKMVDVMQTKDANAIVATRTIYSMDLKKMYVDDIESDGKNMVDTNCMFLHRRLMYLLSFWITPPENRMVSDKAFWQNCTANGVEFVRCEHPTVAYVTKWAWHYQHAGMSVPDDSVWMGVDKAGNHFLVKHKDRRLYE